MKKTTLLLALILMSFTTISHAENFQIDRKYKVSMDVNLDFMAFDTNLGDADTDTFEAKLATGYFLNDMIEIGPSVSFYRRKESRTAGDATYEAISLLLCGAIHFPTATRFDPYIGIGAGVAQFDFDFADDTTFIYGIDLGFDYFINKNVSINPSINYQVASIDILGQDVDIENLGVNIGFGIHF